MTTDDNVIGFDEAKRALGAVPDEPRRAIQRKRSDYSKPYCPHRHFLVSLREAEITCADCNAPLDPWMVLRELATNHEHTWQWVEQMNKDRKKLKDEIVALKRERDNLRAAIRRQRGKLSAPVIQLAQLMAKDEG